MIKAFKTVLFSAALLCLSQISFSQVANTKKEIGLQLYSVRGEIGKQKDNTKAEQEFQELLHKISKIGYTSVEAAGYGDGKFYNLSPLAFRKAVEEADMKVISSHTSKGLSAAEMVSGDFSASLAWWDDCIRAHKEAGMKYIVTPWLDAPKSLADLKVQCEYFNAVGKKCREQGILFGYHNHAHEFGKVEGKEVMLDFMIANTNPDYVFYELDVYWTVIGNASPVEYFKKYPGRFLTLHIKDHQEIGQSGMVGFDAIFQHADIAGVKHIFVELESTKNNIFSALQQSFDYLNKAPFVQTSYSK